MSEENRASLSNLDHAKVLKSELLEGKDAKWIHLKSIQYRNPAGEIKTWESAERKTRPQSSDIDSVGAVAILQKPDGPEIVLQRQYRPPIGKVCIEIPSGLVDSGESPEGAALRELREETGYVGEVMHHSTTAEGAAGSSSGSCGVMWADPGMTNANTKLVHVQVDMTKEENRNLKPELEENEFIETFTVKLDHFYEEVCKMEAQGYGIDARVATMAEGFELRRRFFG